MNIDIPGALFTLSLSIPIFKVKSAPVISMLIEGLPLVGKNRKVGEFVDR